MQNGLVEVTRDDLKREDAIQWLLNASVHGRLVGWGISDHWGHLLGNNTKHPFSCRLWSRYALSVMNGKHSCIVWDVGAMVNRKPRDGETAVKAYKSLKRVEEAFGVKLRRWDGLGQMGCAILRGRDILHHWPPPESDEEMRRIMSAFHGGRIQAVRIGHGYGHARVYDLNSAYAWALSQMPSLKDAKWVDGNCSHAGNVGVYDIEWNFTEASHGIYPFPFRMNEKVSSRLSSSVWDGGQTIWPQRGRGMVWSPIYNAFLETGDNWKGYFKIHNSWFLHCPYIHRKPFSFLNDLYNSRSRMSNPMDNRIAKWALASVWGKLCQIHGQLRPNRYQCMVWAGLSTATVNAELLRAAMSNPRAVWAFAVDSVITCERLKGNKKFGCPKSNGLKVSIGEGLGEWKEEHFEEIQAYQPGLYRAKHSGLYRPLTPHKRGWRQRARGIPKGKFPWSLAEERWKLYGPATSVEVPLSNGELRVALHPGTMEELMAQDEFFGSSMVWKQQCPDFGDVSAPYEGKETNW